MQLPTRSTHQTLHLGLFRCFASSSRSSSAACSANGAPIKSAKKSSSRWSAQHISPPPKLQFPCSSRTTCGSRSKKTQINTRTWQINEKRSGNKITTKCKWFRGNNRPWKRNLYPISWEVTVYLRLFTIARWEGLQKMKQQDFIPFKIQKKSHEPVGWCDCAGLFFPHSVGWFWKHVFHQKFSLKGDEEVQFEKYDFKWGTLYFLQYAFPKTNHWKYLSFSYVLMKVGLKWSVQEPKHCRATIDATMLGFQQIEMAEAQLTKLICISTISAPYVFMYSISYELCFFIRCYMHPHPVLHKLGRSSSVPIDFSKGPRP